MGKSLIIKDADFSANGISTSVGWVGGYPSTILAGEAGKVSANNNITAPIATEVTRLGMVGKTIKYIKINAASSGTIGVYTYNTSDGTTSNQQSISVTSGINILTLPTPIVISSNAVSIGIQGNGIVRYWSNSASYTARGWQYAQNGVVRIPIDFGYDI